MARLPIKQSAFDNPRLRVVADYLSEHISDPNRLPLPEAARIANVCPEHFSRFFHKRAGVCFHHWQRAFRMERAKHIILDERMQLGAVGRAVGYLEPSTFGRVFRRYQGITPRQLLKLIREHPELKPVLRSELPKFTFQLFDAEDRKAEVVPLVLFPRNIDKC